MKPTELPNHDQFIAQSVAATSVKAMKDLLAGLPIAPEGELDLSTRSNWREGYFYWVPVGGDRGNAGRIRLAGSPENPIAERTINAMEALVELERRREIKATPDSLPPQSPREAVRRYFDLPPLDLLPAWPTAIRGKKPRDHAREIARRIRVKLVREIRPVQYTVLIEDDGIGQTPERMHLTLLSLGQSDKSDKPYLIGVFGQGGSSAYAGSEYSWLISRRAVDVLDGQSDGVGWTAVKHLFAPPPRRDEYWAYLAAHPDGRVPRLSASVGDGIGLKHGTRIAHIKYDFGQSEPAASLYQSLNHLIFNPVLPYELYTGPNRRPDPMWGNGYRLSNVPSKKRDMNKLFEALTVEKRVED